MPPIPVNLNAPIKPDGVTPQTADTAQQPEPTRTVPAQTTASTTSSGPPPPQPGARPLPPTSLVQQAAPSGPAPPQPGTQPVAQAGQVNKTVIETITQRAGPPPQFGVPAPTGNAAPTYSTNPTTAQNSGPGPTTLNMGPAAPAASPFQQSATAEAGGERKSLEHPPGYQQNPAVGAYVPPPATDMGFGGAQGGNGGILGGGGNSTAAAGDNSVLGWIKQAGQQAGQKLSEAEQEVWKMVNGKK